MRAQVATEFLFTYGWAIMIVLMMIGGLYYLGVIDPSRLLPDKCFFGSGVSCIDQGAANVPTGTEITVLLKNGFGMPIAVQDASRIKISQAENDCNCNDGCGIANTLWEQDETKTMLIKCTGYYSKVDLGIKITYKLVDGSYDRVIEGRIQSKVR